MDIVDKFSSNLKTVLTRALCFAVERNEAEILPEHILFALGTQKGCIAAEILKKAGVMPVVFKKISGDVSVKEPIPVQADGTVLHLSEDAKRIVEKAVLTANIYGHRYIGTEHLLSGLVQVSTPEIQTFFTTHNVDLKFLREQLSWAVISSGCY